MNLNNKRCIGSVLRSTNEITAIIATPSKIIWKNYNLEKKRNLEPSGLIELNLFK